MCLSELKEKGNNQMVRETVVRYRELLFQEEHVELGCDSTNEKNEAAM